MTGSALGFGYVGVQPEVVQVAGRPGLPVQQQRAVPDAALGQPAQVPRLGAALWRPELQQAGGRSPAGAVQAVVQVRCTTSMQPFLCIYCTMNCQWNASPLH